MGGKVDVKSTLNKGTDFTIDLKTWCLVSKAKIQQNKNIRLMQGSISPRELLGTVNFNVVERAPEYPPRQEDSQPF